LAHHLSILPLTSLRRWFFLFLAAALVNCSLLAALPSPLYAQDADTMVYTVAAGETLSEIAAQFGVEPQVLLDLNGLEDADAIFVGQTLRVPVTVDAAQPAPPGTHRVQPGETLSAIAQRYGLVLEDLMALNQIEDPNAVYAGQLLAVGAAVDAGAGAETDAQPTEPPAETATATAADPATETGGDATAAQPRAEPTADPPVESTVTPVALPDAHIVQPGETLTGIARRYGLPAATLKALNNLGDADYIVVGQKLILSVAEVQEQAAPTPAPTETVTETATAAPAETATETATEAAPELAPTSTATLAPLPATHTVQPGETLTGIARRYGLSAAGLQALNGIEDQNSIFVGQVLALAAPTPEPTAGPRPTEPGAAAESAATPEPSAAEPIPTPEPAPIVRSGSPIGSLNRTYQIVFGDTLPRIALRQGVDAAALASLNGFTSVNDPLAAGQTLLLPATADELRPSTPAQEHVVAPGESLSGIAQAYGTTTGDLMAANAISDANAIYPGQRLLIPSLPLGTSGAVLQQIGPASSGYFFYTVQPGDTLSAIAKQFDSTMEALRTYNGLPDNETVYTGLELKIPFGPPALPLNLPPAPMSGTRFVVSLSRQQCWVFEGDKVRYAWNCSTGQADRKTKPGNYAVQSKIPNAKSKVWRLDMPYWLGIYDVGEVENGIHGLPMSWATGKKIWSGLIGQPATFGCAMLDDANASTLYRMAFLGMPVHIVN
jgi:LysM repeat protein